MTIDDLPIIMIIDTITTLTVLQIFGNIDSVEFIELLITTFELLDVGNYRISPKMVDTRTRKSLDECDEDDCEYDVDMWI